LSVAETSLQAYREKIENGSKRTDEEKCFELIDEKGPITMKALEPFMGKNKHKFSGRVRDLKDKGLIRKKGTKDGHQVLVVDSEFVTMEESKEMEDKDDLSDLFVDDKQSDKPEAGEVIWD